MIIQEILISSQYYFLALFALWKFNILMYSFLPHQMNVLPQTQKNQTN